MHANQAYAQGAQLGANYPTAPAQEPMLGLLTKRLEQLTTIAYSQRCRLAAVAERLLGAVPKGVQDQKADSTSHGTIHTLTQLIDTLDSMFNDTVLEIERLERL